jgi:hypothetical protein
LYIKAEKRTIAIGKTSNLNKRKGGRGLIEKQGGGTGNGLDNLGS